MYTEDTAQEDRLDAMHDDTENERGIQDDVEIMGHHGEQLEPEMHNLDHYRKTDTENQHGETAKNNDAENENDNDNWDGFMEENDLLNDLLDLPYEDNVDEIEVQMDDAGESGYELNNHGGIDDDGEEQEGETLQEQPMESDQAASSDAGYHTYPEERERVQKQLVGTYICPAVTSGGLGPKRPLTESEKISLQHYIAWRQSNGTELAYRLHARVLQNATKAKILSLYAAKRLAMDLSGISAKKYDVCPNSCMAYTGEHAMKTKCCYVKPKNVPCNESRFNSKKKPRSQMIYVSCFDMIKAMYANTETSTMLRDRDKLLQKALYLLKKTEDIIKTYSDFGDSLVQEHLCTNLNLFKSPRDIAFALSTDGAQLTMKKQSNTWVAILILLNLPAEIRYQTNNVIIPFIIPGPQSPGDIESFMYPLFEDMAKANEGIWMWDAIDSSYFVNHAHICMILGDMLGSAKMSGMAGHSAVHGDRFSLIEGARSSLNKGSKYQYYPINPPQNQKYNPSRSSYDLDNLPIRDEKLYWGFIEELNKASTKAQANAICKKSGISCMPLAAASAAFIHPSFFPLDPFHLFFENIMPFIWDIWTTGSTPDEDVHLSKDMAKQLGQLVVEGMKTLPPALSGPVRDPHLKRQSQYKAYEWMALIYWYIVPIGIELEMESSVLRNFSKLARIVDLAMTIKPMTEENIQSLQAEINDFLIEYEQLYVGNNPEKIWRCRLCIFQLTHVPMHIRWYGSVRLGSQATVERTIGEAGHKIHSKKSPFANMANIFYEKEIIKALLLYYPQLQCMNKQSDKAILFGKIAIKAEEKKEGQPFYCQVAAIFRSVRVLGPLDITLFKSRWGKCNLSNGRVLSSTLSEGTGDMTKRSRCHFEAQGVDKPIFGKALAFFQMEQTKQNIVVYHQLVKMEKTLNVWRGTWSEKLEVLDVTQIADIIGVWTYNNNVYPLRKHPGSQWISKEEAGTIDDEGKDCQFED